jgi:hypothetical protein
MAMPRFLFLFVAAFVTAVSGFAQSVHWEAGDSGDPADLQLMFQDCSPAGDPQLPHLAGTTLALAGSSSQTTINNFTMSRTTLLLYRARTQGSTAIKIPAFVVQTNKGALTVPAFTGGVPRSASDANVLSRLEVGTPSVWVGEVFHLDYVLDVARRSFNQLGSNIEWNPSPLVVEEWSKFEPSEVNANGEARLHIASRARGYAKTAGPLTLNAATQLVNLQSGSIGFGLFQTPRIEQLSVTSNVPALVVRPLPEPAPAGFNGAVGQFKLTSKIIPSTAAVGEPVTWTIELSGVGNWPDIAGLPQREVSKDFKVVQPQPKRTPAEGKLFDVTLSEDVVLVPTVAGDYVLGPVDFVYFDPASKSYKTVSAPRTKITISPAAAVNPLPASAQVAGTDTASSAASVKTPRPEAKAPAPPQGIPRDPLAGSSVAFTPLRLRDFVAILAAPLAFLLLFWGYLAIDRAQRTDPLRPQREAKDRLAVAIERLKSAPAGERAALLLAWQHDTGILWQLAHAAPAAQAFPDAAWSQLWAESDRALYSPTAELPGDWPQRAEAALAAKRIRGFSALTAFFPRNLFPFVAALAILVWFAPQVHAQEVPAADAAPADPAAAYRRGDFAAAEKGWLETVTLHPSDAVARHNLSLALAQQDRWGEATAHASASFVQDPASPATRSQLALATEKSGFVPAPLVGFLPVGPLQSLARLASPCAWQALAILAAMFFAGGLGAWLFGAYRRPSRLRVISASTACLLALLLGASAAVSLHTYGVLLNRNAAIAWRSGTLRSIPTEADTTQKTTVLAPGSVGVMGKTLLGWVHLTFENGQTGWVRKEEMIGIWQ